MTVRHIEISAKSIWQVIGAVLATLVLIWMAVEAKSLVAMVAISFFFSLALEPGVRWLHNRYGWRRGAATGAIYAGGVLFVVLMVAVLIPSIVDLATTVGDEGAGWIEDISEWSEDTLGIELTSPESAADLAETADGAIGGFGDDPFGTLVGIASSGATFLFNLATIAMFTFYFTADAPRVRQVVLRFFSPGTQERIHWTWDQAIVQTGGYFYSRMILMFINGVGFFFVLVAVGMPTALSVGLALFGAFVSVFIPAVGTYIGGAIPVLVTLAVEGFTAALIVLGYVFLYQIVENYWLSPKISAETMDLNPGVAFGAALAGGAIAGPMGAFTALPIAALIKSFVGHYAVSYEVVYESGGGPGPGLG